MTSHPHQGSNNKLPKHKYGLKEADTFFLGS
jgi:hypothetical protein